jgi:hypothetical protein
MLLNNSTADQSAKTNGSTGPRSPEGKARSSKNSLKHGYTSRELVVAEDQHEEFDEFKATLLEETKPEGQLQMIAFNNILHAAWTLARIQRIEAEYLARGSAAFEDKDTRRTLELLLRYQARHERAYHKARKDLEELQTAVITRMTLPADVQVVTPPLANAMKINSAKRTGDKAWPVEETITLERVSDQPLTEEQRRWAEQMAAEADLKR